MEPELEIYLLSLGVSLEVIGAMKEHKIDISTIQRMQNSELMAFLKIGEVYKVKEYAAVYYGKRSVTETFAIKLKNKLHGLASKNSGPSPYKNCGKSQTLQGTRKVYFSWHCDGKLVRGKHGGGTREADMPKVATKSDLLQKALSFFFPNNESCKGHLNAFNYHLRDSCNIDFDENLTVTEIYEITGLSRLRFCLHTESIATRNVDVLATGVTGARRRTSAGFTKKPKRTKTFYDNNSKYCLSSSTDSDDRDENPVEDDSIIKVYSEAKEEIPVFTKSDEENFSINDFLILTKEVPLPPTNEVAEGQLDLQGHEDLDVIQSGVLEISNLRAKLNNIAAEISSSPETVLINASRQNTVSAIINAMKRSSFSPTKKLDVIFVDVDETPEGAVDDGGPTRELFRLALQELKESAIFGGGPQLPPQRKCANGNSNEDGKNAEKRDSHSKTLIFNVTALQKRKYLEAGKVFAMAIIHSGPRPSFLSPTLFELIIGNYFVLPTIEDIHNTEAYFEIQNILSAATQEEFTKELGKCVTLLELGVTPTSPIEQKDRIIADVLHHIVIDRTRKAVEQFVEGLNLLCLVELMQRYPEEAKELFVGKVKKVKASYINDLFVIQRSKEGCQRRLIENQVIAYWKDYLQNCEDGDCAVAVEDILAFTTGANTEPALGFPQTPTVEFLHDEPHCKFPKSNTCGLVLRLPVATLDYDDFVKNMDFGILNGLPTFGFA